MAVEKLSLLLFSRNDIDKALPLIEDLYDHVDEIVLIDSSTKALHKQLLRKKASMDLTKLRIFYIVPLGYLEPALAYAMGKCRYNWIFLLGTDERISPKLKSDLKGLLTSAKCSAFSIIRNEQVGENSRGAYRNWQTRVFRKGSTTFRGIIHEEAKIDGQVCKLDPDLYYIDHVDRLKGSASSGYAIMEKFLRMSYKAYNERLIDYFYKVTVPSSHSRAGAGGGSLQTLLSVYEKLGRKKSEQEVSDLDYYVFYLLHALATSIKSHNIHGVFASFRDASNTLMKIRGWQREPDGDENFNISKMLYEKGLITFLGLDKESTINRLNEKYGYSKDAGIGLLIKLLKLRYEKGARWLD